MTALLWVDALEVQGADTIVRPTRLTVEPGEPFTILGETGCGKSLLAQAIMGTLPAGLRATGRVGIADQSFDAADSAAREALWGRVLTMLPQEPWLALDPTMRVKGQVAEGHELVQGLPEADAARRADEDLSALGLEEAGGKLPMELSGGMAQRVAFAAARAGGARIVIADEPTKGLDVARRADAVALLRREANAAGGLFTITHDVAVARGLGGRVAIMRDGEILEQGPAEALLDAPQTEYGRRLVAADPEAWPERAAAPALGEPVVTARGLTKSRGGALLFRDLDLTVRAGEIVGVFGASGSGKSSLGDVLLGLLAPDAGEVVRHPDSRRHRFQKLYQDPPAAFPPRVTVRRALADLIRRHRLDGAAVAPTMERLRLHPGLLDRLPREVSGGELQRLALLRVLLLAPVFLVADEPTSRLDLITQQQTIGMIVDLARERGCGVLLVSHDPALLQKSADRVLRLPMA